MDANKVIENLLERVKNLTRENAFLVAQLQTIEEQQKANMEAPVEESEQNAQR
jgi:hypothetical protein